MLGILVLPVLVVPLLFVMVIVSVAVMFVILIVFGPRRGNGHGGHQECGSEQYCDQVDVRVRFGVVTFVLHKFFSF